MGYDINGDQCVDISKDRLSGQGDDYPETYWRLLIGSSFAAPAALRSALFSDLELNVCLNL